MENDIFTTVWCFRECLQNELSEKLDRLLQLLPARGLLEFDAMEILGPLLKSPTGSNFNQ